MKTANTSTAPLSKAKYVIIGNSAAAVGAIEGIRQIDASGSIILVSKECEHTYSRPLISYLLKGAADEEKMKYRKDDFYSKMSAAPLLGKEATKIEDGVITLLDGEKIEYEKLLIAAGSAPFVPPIKGLSEVQNKFTFMSLSDAKSLDAKLNKDSSVLIMGAGLIGLKCAEGIADKVEKITVVDMADRILPSILDKESSDIVQKHIEAQGVEFILGDSVSSFEGQKAILNSKSELSFDVLVVAVGVRPNSQLAETAGIKVNRGIETNGYCQTNIKNIYAAGDCTESFDISSNMHKVLALLPNAYMQGECAGKNMAGEETLYKNAIPLNSIGFFGLHMVTAGSYDGEELIIRENGGYKKLITRDNKLCGFIILGDVSRSGIYTALLRNQTPLDSIDFKLIVKKPQLMAFSKKERAKMLGGAK